MIKPKKLSRGDKVAIVSLSSGLAGERLLKHRYELGKKRLEEVFGLEVITMPNALKGCDFVNKHPKLRADDLMSAFKEPSIKGIFCNIGGDDTIRLLPFIDYEIIKNNPKVFMGYSDTTINHFMMYKAGLTSFYGPSIMCEFAENKNMHDYTVDYIKQTLFESRDVIEIKSSPKWTSEFLDWVDEKNNDIGRKMIEEQHGFEILQGTRKTKGQLLGGCVDVFPMLIGTKIWPTVDEWKSKILFLETSEDEIQPLYLKYILRNLIAQGIIDVINGIIVGKPKHEKYYEEYKEVYTEMIGVEANRPDLPIIYNVNFGHASPICILPYGILAELDVNNKKIYLRESAVTE